MILVAGLAVGFVGLRSRLAEYQEELLDSSFPSLWARVVFDFAGFVIMLSSLLIFILRLRRPRPAIRRVARQPGTAACFMVLFLAMGEAYSHLAYRISQWDHFNGRRIDLQTLGRLVPPHEASYAIAAIWILFALGRIGRPEAGWIDRAGLLVGWICIGWGVVGSYLSSYFE